MSGLTILLLAGSFLAGLASATEVASFALPYARVKELERGGGPRARALAALRARPLRLLAVVWAIRIGATVAAAIAAWEIAEALFGATIGVRLAAVVVTIAALMAIHLLARPLSIRVAESLALSAAPLLWVASVPLRIISGPGEVLVGIVAPSAAQALPRITDREIRDLLGQASGEPDIDEHERRLIQRAFLLDQTTAYDAMTPRVDILAWPETKRLAELAPELRTVRYSRIPLYRESVDKITGILYVRDAYQALISGQRDVELLVLAREPLLVPGSVTLEKLLVTFQTRRMHMGIVIDEYGGTDGLITLEDILEELVGEIVDETDIAREPIVRLGRHEILVDGSADLREINHFLNTSFPLLEHRSLNGYLLDLLGRVPQEGETLVQEGVSIEVAEATETQVVRARLTRLPQGGERAAVEEARSTAAQSSANEQSDVDEEPTEVSADEEPEEQKQDQASIEADGQPA